MLAPIQLEAVATAEDSVPLFSGLLNKFSKVKFLNRLEFTLNFLQPLC